MSFLFFNVVECSTNTQYTWIAPTSYDVIINYIERIGGGLSYFDYSTFTSLSGQLLYQIGTICGRVIEEQGSYYSAVTRTIMNISVDPDNSIC